jgi:hypothetical protein
MTFAELIALPLGSVIEAGWLLPTITQDKLGHRIDEITLKDGKPVAVVTSVFALDDILLLRLEGRADLKGGIKWAHRK